MIAKPELEEVYRLVHPIKMTIKVKDKADLRLYFETFSQAKLFTEFVEALIKGVKEKLRKMTREEWTEWQDMCKYPRAYEKKKGREKTK